jgi:hypothetical protein
LQDESLSQLLIRLIAVLDGDESSDCLARELVANTNDCSLSNSMVLNEGCLNFGGRETVTADINDIINTSPDPVVTFVVTSSPIASELELLVTIHYSSSNSTYIIAFIDV